MYLLIYIYLYLKALKYTYFSNFNSKAKNKMERKPIYFNVCDCSSYLQFA